MPAWHWRWPAPTDAKHGVGDQRTAKPHPTSMPSLAPSLRRGMPRNPALFSSLIGQAHGPCHANETCTFSFLFSLSLAIFELAMAHFHPSRERLLRFAHPSPPRATCFAIKPGGETGRGQLQDGRLVRVPKAKARGHRSSRKDVSSLVGT